MIPVLCDPSTSIHSLHIHGISRGPFGVIAYTVRMEGLHGLFRGFSSNVARNFPGEMVFFATYEQMRKLMKPAGQVKDDIGTCTLYPQDCCFGRAGFFHIVIIMFRSHWVIHLWINCWHCVLGVYLPTGFCEIPSASPVC